MIEKAYASDGQSCQVTFVLPGELQAQHAWICGEFTDWQPQVMKQTMEGKFTATFTLPTQCAHQFRYLVDETEWHNDWHADAYVPNPFGSENSVVNT
jgi:hypothetical protein